MTRRARFALGVLGAPIVLRAAALLVACDSTTYVDLGGGSGADGSAVVTGAGQDATIAPGDDAGTTETSDADVDDGGADATTTVDATPTGVLMYIATGYRGRRMTSTDGTHWSNDVENDANAYDDVLSGLAIGQGTIVAAGHTGIYTSTDGKTWTHLPEPLPQAWPGLEGASAVFANGQFSVISENDTWTSPDGVTFTKHTPDASLGTTHWNGLAYGNGHYVAVGDSFSKASEDGVDWHDFTHDQVDGGTWSSVAFGAGVFVMVGSGGQMSWTEDGVTLNDVSDSTLGDVGAVVYGNGLFVATAQNDVVTSTDGKSWTKHPSTYLSVGGSGGSMFLGVSWYANLATSTDGYDWTVAYSGDGDGGALVRVMSGMVGK